MSRDHLFNSELRDRRNRPQIPPALDPDEPPFAEPGTLHLGDAMYEPDAFDFNDAIYTAQTSASRQLQSYCADAVHEATTHINNIALHGRANSVAALAYGNSSHSRLSDAIRHLTNSAATSFNPQHLDAPSADWVRDYFASLSNDAAIQIAPIPHPDRTYGGILPWFERNINALHQAAMITRFPEVAETVLTVLLATPAPSLAQIDAYLENSWNDDIEHCRQLVRAAGIAPEFYHQAYERNAAPILIAEQQHRQHELETAQNRVAQFRRTLPAVHFMMSAPQRNRLHALNRRVSSARMAVGDNHQALQRARLLEMVAWQEYFRAQRETPFLRRLHYRNTDA